MKNILEICQEAADLSATQKPEDLFAGRSQQESIFQSVAKDTLDGLLRYGDWQELTKEGCLRTVGGHCNYFIKDFCPDFYCLLNNTVYVRNAAEKVIGSITPEQWMKEKYFSISSLGLKFKIQNGMFKFLTPPPDNMKIVFLYRSANIVYDAAKGYEEKTELTRNTDIPIFDEFLVKKGIIWRWYRRNGMPYEEEYNEYQRELKSRFGNGLATQDIPLHYASESNFPSGVIINAAKKC
ncbi:MAG: hypothetical protein IJ545_02050 [Alphaproteobacteria bacterium]|nr:hypothetical protein [Alphaproteobacteria bacterium]